MREFGSCSASISGAAFFPDHEFQAGPDLIDRADLYVDKVMALPVQPGNGPAAPPVPAPAPTVAAPAEAASYTPRRYRGEPYLPPAQRHLVSRFSYGTNRALVKEVRRQGGARKWFDRQLSPASISDKKAKAVNGWWPSLNRDRLSLWSRDKNGTEDGWQWVLNYQRWVLNRRIRTRRPEKLPIPDRLDQQTLADQQGLQWQL